MGADKGLLPYDSTITPIKPSVQVRFPLFTRTDFSPRKFSHPLREAMALGDLNQDRKLDLVTTFFDPYSIEPKVLVFFGKDQFGSFDPPTELSTLVDPDYTANPASIMIQDVDQDSILDIVIASNSIFQTEQKITIFWGEGNGTFRRGNFDFRMASGVSKVLVEKLRYSDPMPSLFWIDEEQKQIYLRKNDGGTRNFLPPLVAFTNLGKGEVILWKATDLDYDQNTDFVLLEKVTTLNKTSFSIRMIKGDGKGGFVEAPAFTLPKDLIAYDLIDMDQDGLLDLLVSEPHLDEKGFVDPGQRRLLVWKGDSSGRYRMEAPLLDVVIPEIDMLGGFLADLDKNGIEELLCFSSNRILIFRKGGDGWKLSRVLNGQEELGFYFLNTVSTYDLETDGKQEIITYSRAGVLNMIKQEKTNFSLYKQTSMVPLDLGPLIATTISYSSGNGLPELRIFDQNKNWMYRLTSSDIPLFQPDSMLYTGIALSNSTHAAALGSLRAREGNNFMPLLGKEGGNEKLFLYDRCSEPNSYRAQTCGKAAEISLASIKNPNGIVITDTIPAEKDGNMDLLISSPDGIYQLQGNGWWSFGSPTLISLLPFPQKNVTSVKTVDLNQDGLLDIVLSSSIERKLAVFLRARDTKAWVQSASIEAKEGVGPIATADMNNDLIPDLVWVDGWGSKVHISYMDENGQLRQGAIQIDVGAPVEGMTLADLNQDQIPDIVVTLPNQNAIRLILSKKDRSGFFAMAPLPTGQRPTKVVVTEKTKDHDLGIYVVNQDSGTISAFVLPRWDTDWFSAP